MTSKDRLIRLRIIKAVINRFAPHLLKVVPREEPLNTASRITDDIFKALEMQDELQAKYTGGTVLHGFIGERLPSVEATKALVKTIAENFHLPYFTLTPTFSICPNHGYLEGEHEFCPKCDQVSVIEIPKGGK